MGVASTSRDHATNTTETLIKDLERMFSIGDDDDDDDVLDDAFDYCTRPSTTSSMQSASVSSSFAKSDGNNNNVQSHCSASNVSNTVIMSQQPVPVDATLQYAVRCGSPTRPMAAPSASTLTVTSSPPTNAMTKQQSNSGLNAIRTSSTEDLPSFSPSVTPLSSSSSQVPSPPPPPPPQPVKCAQKSSASKRATFKFRSSSEKGPPSTSSCTPPSQVKMAISTFQRHCEPTQPASTRAPVSASSRWPPPTTVRPPPPPRRRSQDALLPVASSTTPKQTFPAAGSRPTFQGLLRQRSAGAAGECCSCLDRASDCVIYRCGHICLCYECAIDIRQTHRPPLCPICRQMISDVIRIYRV